MESDDSDEHVPEPATELDSVAPVQARLRRIAWWLLAAAIVAALVVAIRLAGVAYYNPPSRIPEPPDYPFRQGLLGVSQAVVAELETVEAWFANQVEPDLRLNGEILEIRFPRTVGDRLFGKRDETATVFSIRIGGGDELRVLALRDQTSTVFAVEAPSSRSRGSIEGLFLGLPAGSDSPFGGFVLALNDLMAEVESAPSRELTSGEVTIFGAFARSDEALLEATINGHAVLNHLAAALQEADADVGLGSPAFLILQTPGGNRVINGLYESQFRLILEPLWGGSPVATLAHELVHAYMANVVPDRSQVQAAAASYLDEAHPRLFELIVGDLYERLGRNARAEEALAFLVGSLAIDQTTTVAGARLLQNENLLSISERIVSSDIVFLIELGLLPDCMDPGNLGVEDQHIPFAYFESARAACL